jgi:hypothetical protein
MKRPYSGGLRCWRNGASDTATAVSGFRQTLEGNTYRPQPNPALALHSRAHMGDRVHPGGSPSIVVCGFGIGEPEEL